MQHTFPCDVVKTQPFPVGQEDLLGHAKVVLYQSQGQGMFEKLEVPVLEVDPKPSHL